MGFPNIFKILSLNSRTLPVSTRESLVPKPTQNGIGSNLFWIFRRLISGKKIDGGSRTEEEEKVYSWLYSLAQADKDIVFEYVESTERDLRLLPQ